MCGIAGYAGWRCSPEQSAQHLAAMCQAIRHRGPDDKGFFIAEGVALGMRRLSIIDVDSGGQPIGNEDGSIQVVFNGEIYNYRDLQARLRTGRHQLRTQSDTETLVHLYEEYGDALVDYLRGMFAFALWDGAGQRLLIARDRLGIKPLYYCELDGGVAFASELKALLQLPNIARQISLPAVADYLSLGYVPDPDCIYAGICKLPPAHLLTWHRDTGVQVGRYWTPFRPENKSIDEREACDELRRLLAESVKYRLIADVPLGAFLSGGIDSSAVVAEMARQMDRPVRTFSIGFAEAEFDEAADARTVARELATDHTELVVRPDADALVEQIVTSFDEPFADSSAIPTYLVSQLARSHVKVALSGDGGDELFGGYTRYADLQRRSFVPPAPLRATISGFAQALPHATYGRARLFELGHALNGRYASMVAHPLPPRAGGVARAAVVAAGKDLEHVLERWFARVPKRQPVSQAALVDLVSYLPGDILTKVDRMSMAVSLEARVPLLDHHLVEFATALPDDFRVRDGTGKWIFRKAVRGLVPETVLTKPKQGFGVPLVHWLRRDLRHRVQALLEPGNAIYEYADPAAVRRIIGEHTRGRRDHYGVIWKLICLDVWLATQRSIAQAHAGDAIVSMEAVVSGSAA